MAMFILNLGTIVTSTFNHETTIAMSSLLSFGAKLDEKIAKQDEKLANKQDETIAELRRERAMIDETIAKLREESAKKDEAIREENAHQKGTYYATAGGGSGNRRVRILTKPKLRFACVDQTRRQSGFLP